MHRNFADIQLKRNLLRAALAAQRKRGSQRGMTGEWQFLLYREDAYTNALLALGGGVAGQNERGFGEVHLFGERLHLGVGESSAVGEYGQRITLERTRREHVPLRHCQTPRC